MAKHARRSGAGARGAIIILALVGAIFLTVGFFFIMSQNAFAARSDAAQLTVTLVDSRTDAEGDTLYRPTFEARSTGGRIIEYSGGAWVAPKPHSAGDVVGGRVDWAAGEIRSDAMMKTGARMGILFAFLGGIMLAASLVVAGRMTQTHRRAAPGR